MIEIIVDNDIINGLRLCITQQNSDIELSYFHLLDNEYSSTISRLDLNQSGFQYWYKSLVSNTIKQYLASERIVYSSVPSAICYFPNLQYYHCASHPLCKNCHSVFLPLTQWTESNTIRLKHKDQNMPIGHTINSCYIIADNEDIIIPEHRNLSNNTYFGLFFYIMSYQNYKSSMIYSSKNIGGFFSLL